VRGILVRLAIIAVIGVGAYVLRDRISGNASDLAVGDCFDVPASATIEDVQHHPCTDAHDAEVVYVGDHPAPDGAAPLTDEGLQGFVMGTCGGAMIEYVGGLQSVETSAELQDLDLGAIYPTDDDWNGGERTITCYLHSVDGSVLTKSFKAAS
jgi:hypothetical protein